MIKLMSDFNGSVLLSETIINTDAKEETVPGKLILELDDKTQLVPEGVCQENLHHVQKERMSIKASNKQRMISFGVNYSYIGKIQVKLVLNTRFEPGNFEREGIFDVYDKYSS
ncbi:hypothetical protein RCL_jg25711.t1 [Rhizophagus clarus]|uniref:Uncharacterized protein n=1 Tax=Rhizophagus clarus TaxID=94130 RepID=A0A8H3LTZ5_9GLOM|nr:hypothetical protein RCL_jg25711.t1 [Rhizophagus clarus]